MKNAPYQLLLVLVSLGLFAILSGCADNGPANESQPAASPEPAPATPPAAETQPIPEQSPAAQAQPAPAADPVVVLQTTKGDITIELWPDKAPITVENFLTYAREGFYDGTIFHRVISGFMIQGGGLTANMAPKPTNAPIINEASADLPNLRGTIAMARTSAPHSATSQFFINHKDNPFLNYQGPTNPGYAVFGKVIDGMDVVDAIAAVATGNRAGHQNVPIEPIIIQKATIRNP
jgi:cyclophilin family peptidyl-prolyl cis-trans isomerase